MYFTNRKTLLTGILALATAISSVQTLAELRWDWSQIDLENIQFNPDFLLGTAVSEPQVSGFGPYSNWTDAQFALDKKGKPRIHEGHMSGTACDFWNKHDQMVASLKKDNIKLFRFSVEWSWVEPVFKGNIKYEVINRYKELCAKLIAAGIQPMVTLHHFTHPRWFESKGAFEKEENIQDFVDFCSLMARELGDQVPQWITINEPGVYVMQGYLRGVWPPFKQTIKHGMLVTKHLLQAHIQATQAIKAELPAAQVSFAHSITQFDAYNENMIENLSIYYVNQLFHEAITEFFASGRLKFDIPLYGFEYVDERAPKSLDFFAINYYSHVLLQLEIGLGGFKVNAPAHREGDVPTDMPYDMYAEGLYRSIADVSQRIGQPQNIPIYITENGIADGKDDRRATFIKRYMYALKKAVDDGYNVKGYCYWSYLDNFEWSEGYSMQFGLYHVDFNTKIFTKRDGAQAYFDVVNRTYGINPIALS